MKFLLIYFIAFISIYCSAINQISSVKVDAKSKYVSAINEIQDAMDKEQFDVALDKAEQLTKDYPDFHEAFALAGDALFNLKSYEEAYKSYLRVLYLFSDTSVYDKAAEALSKIDNPKLISIRLARLVGEKENDFVIRNLLTKFYIILGLYQKGAIEASTVLKLSPNDSEALTNLAIINIYLKDYKKSEYYVGESIKNSKDNDKLHFLKGYLFIANDNDLKIGENELIKAIKMNPFSSLYYYNLAYIYMMGNKFDDATKLLKSALDLDPKNNKLIYALAQNYFLDNKLEKALDVFEELIKLSPNIHSGYLGAGKVYLQLKDYDNTIKYYNLAAQISKNEQGNADFFNSASLFEVYFQKYFYFLLLFAIVGIIAIGYLLKRYKEEIPKL